MKLYAMVTLAFVGSALYGALPTVAEPIELGCQNWVPVWNTPSANPFRGSVDNPWLVADQGCSGWIEDFDDPWEPNYIEETSIYHIFRMMDFNGTNGHYIADGQLEWAGVPDASWESRRKPEDGCQVPLAYEYQIDLCNRINADLWLNIPHRADDDYCYNLALLVKERLNTNLKVFVEWSNESWLGMFPSHQYSIARGTEMGFGSGYAAGAAYHTYAALKAHAQFERVFGEDSPRLVRLLAGQVNNYGVAELICGSLENSKVNPDGRTVDGYAVAPYFPMGGAAQAIEWCRRNKEIANSHGVPNLYMYEGGLEDPVQTQAAYDETMKFLEGVEGILTGGCIYMHAGSDAPWALIPNCAIGYDAAMQYPKYKAVADYCARLKKSQPLASVAPRDRPALHRQQQTGTNRVAYDLFGRVLPTSGKHREHTDTGVHGVGIAQGGGMFVR